MANGFLALLLGLALQFTAGALASLRPAALVKDTAAAAASALTLEDIGQPDEPVTGTVNAAAFAGGNLFSFCLGTDLRALRQAAADALGLTPEALAEALAGGRTLGQVAEDHGVSRDEMEAALREAAQASLRAELEPLVAAGDLTQEQAEALLALQAAQDQSHLLDLGLFFAVPSAVEIMPGEWPDFDPGLGGGPAPFGDGLLPAGPGGFGFRFQFRADGGQPFTFELSAGSPEVHTALAQALGLSEAELASRLDAGQALTEIAEAQGVDTEALTAAWREAGIAKARAELDAAVAEGDLTRTQADDILAEIEQALSGSKIFPSLRPVFGGEGRWPFVYLEQDVTQPTD